MPEVEVFEFVHHIHNGYLEKFKEQEFKENILSLLSYEVFQNGTLGKTTATWYIMHKIMFRILGGGDTCYSV
jgi:hypothetical protein